jgi:Asp-tRNA(Asn)/Glu-tRNA(Gln) amidotransferase A subunit family amidase
VGCSAESLPIGVQVAGQPYQDELVLRVAELLDEDFGYRPPALALASGVPLQ